MNENKNLKVLNQRYKDIKKIEKTFKKLGGDKKRLGLALIDELYFMGEALYQLRTQAKAANYIERFEQGSQKFDREHPAMKSYNTTLKNYQSIIKQINDLLPMALFNDFNKEEKEKPGEKLLKYIASDE